MIAIPVATAAGIVNHKVFHRQTARTKIMPQAIAPQPLPLAERNTAASRNNPALNPSHRVRPLLNNPRAKNTGAVMARKTPRLLNCRIGPVVFGRSEASLKTQVLKNITRAEP